MNNLVLDISYVILILVSFGGVVVGRITKNYGAWTGWLGVAILATMILFKVV